jgi:ankyrin repeat protein
LSARRLLIDGFKLSAADSNTPSENRGQFCFQIAMAQIDGFCAAPDLEEAVDWLLKAAELGSDPARAIAHRLFYNLKPSPAHVNRDLEAKLMSWLTDAAGLGTPFALNFLQSLDEIAYQEAKQQSLAKLQPQSMMASLDIPPTTMVEILFSTGNVEQALARPGATANDIFLNMERDTFLHFGAAYGVSMDKFTAFMDRWTPDIDQQNEAGDTPLLTAMRAGKSEHAMALLRRGAKGDIRNKLGQTPCHWIVQFDDAGTVDGLLDDLHAANADFSSVADRNDLDPRVHYTAVPFKGTPLHWAVLHGHTYAVGALLRRGADPLQVVTYPSSPTASAIDLALKLWEHELVGRLIDFCGDRFNPRMVPHADGAEKLPPWLRKGTTNWTIRSMMTPYHWQLVWHGADCLKAFAQTLGELRRRGLAHGDLDYILAFAMVTYSLDPLKVIFDFFHEFITADLLDKAFSLSGFQFHPGTVRFLFERLVDAEGAIESAAEKCVFSFVRSGASDEFVLQRATDILGNVDVRDDIGDTLFAVAVQNGNFDAATELLRLEADVNALLPARNEQTGELKVNVLHELILHNNDSVVSALNYLLEPHHPFKAKVPSFVVDRESGITALHLASQWDCDSVFETILGHFGEVQSINATTERGFTALHLAANAGQLTHARLLCEAGADVNAKTAEGLTSRDVCHSTAVFRSPNNDRSLAYWESVLIRRLHIDAYLRGQGGTTTRKRGAMKMPIEYKFLRKSIVSDFPRLFDEALALTPNELRTQAHLDALLFFAAREGTANTIRRLLCAGADACARSKSAATPLHVLAARTMYLDVKLKAARALLLAGADARARDAAGRCSVAVAYGLGDRGMVRFLLSGVCAPMVVVGKPGEAARVENESDEALLAEFEAEETILRALISAAGN